MAYSKQYRQLTYTVIAADTDYVATSQTPLAAGDLTLDGVTTFATPQPLSISCAGADSGRTFTIVGKGITGNDVSFTMAGSNGSITNGTVYVTEVTSVSVDDATAGAVTVGVLGKAVTPIEKLDIESRHPFNFAYHVDIGTATFTVESTLNDFEASGFNEQNASFATIEASGSVDVFGSSTVPCTGIRLNVSAFTSGSIVFTILQAGR
jgi:hypothetical protein